MWPLISLLSFLVALVLGYFLGRKDRSPGTGGESRQAHEMLLEASASLNSEVTLLEREVVGLESGINGLIRNIDKEGQFDGTTVPFGTESSSPYGAQDAPPLQRLRSGLEKLAPLRCRVASISDGLRTVNQELRNNPSKPKHKKAGDSHTAPTPVSAPPPGGVSFSAPAPEPTYSPAPREVSWSPAPLQGVAKLIDLYNRAMDDRLAGDEFRDAFEPIRIGTANAVERRHNLRINPEFTQASDGDFFAVPATHPSQYWVVPRFGLTIESVNYGAGAIGLVFGRTHGHNPQLHYSRYRIESPATFACEGGKHWVLLEPGKLSLGVGN